MKILKIIFVLTTILLCVNEGRKSSEASTSYQPGEIVEGGGQVTEQRGKLGINFFFKYYFIWTDHVFQPIIDSYDLIEEELNSGIYKIDDEDSKIEYFLNTNKNSNIYNPEFIKIFYKKLFETRNYYKNALFEQKREAKKLIKRPNKGIFSCLNSSTLDSQYLDKIKEIEEDFEEYQQSMMHNKDVEIFNKLKILKSHSKAYCLQIKDINSDNELNKSLERCENKGKDCSNEIRRMIALNEAIKFLCTTFKTFSHGIKGNDLKKFIDCKGNWNQQGKANQQFEAELFGLSQVENKADDSYFNESDLLNVEIVKRYGDSFISMPIQTIDNFANLDQWLLDNITMCRFERPTPVQKYSISLLSYKNNDGKYEYDLLAMSETGSGKTAAFLIPIIDRLLKKRKSGQQLNKVRVAKDGKNHTCIPNALIIAPTRELANQTFKEALKLAYRTPIVPALINGDHNYLEQVGNFKSGCDILIATPGRLIDMISQEHVNLKGCEFFVIDETDELLDKSFEEQTSAIVEQLPTEEKRTTGLFLYKINKLIIVMFSATYNDKVDKLVDKFLKDDYIKLTIARKTPPNLFEEVIFVEDINKSNVLKQVVKKIAKETPNYKIVIFSNKKNTCSSISSNLTQQGWKNLEFHADVPKREENLNKFRKGEVKILVASDAFQRGHDVKDITHIINYDVPKDYRIYVHRVGRTARAGKHGTAISFVNKTSNILLNIYEAAMERNNKNFIYSSDILQIIDQLIQEREKKKWENEIEKDVRREISRMRSSGRYFQQTGYIQNVENNNQNVEYYGW